MTETTPSEDNNVVKTPDPYIGKFTTLTKPAQEALEPTLAEASLTRLRSWYADRGLRPSTPMWEGIEDLCLCLQRMAEGEADRAFFLSSLDPGVGKTQTVFHFLLSLLASPKHEDVGAVVFMFTKDEIKTFVSEALEAGVPESAFAARVNKEDVEVNGLGCGDPQKARILFTTQQRLVTICTGRSFGEVQEFRYRGRPRQVRIWDEGLLPAQKILINGRGIAGLYRHFPKGIWTELIRDLDRFREDLNRAEDRSLIEVPDLAAAHRVPASDAQRQLREKDYETQNTAADLWHLFGRRALVRKDGNPEPTIVSYRDNLPDDLPPVAVLDASGRVATAYTLWERYRGGLKRLKSGSKIYDNLTLHVWRIGGGATSFQNDGDTRRNGIVQTIKSKPDEPWLVICHKKYEKQLRSEIEAELLGTGVTAEFTHWGLHRAANKYRSIGNIVLAGTMFLPPSVLEATSRAAAACSPEEGLLTGDQERELLLGHQSDIILQAICRGTVRATIDGHCGRCDAYIIAHPKHGIIERLREQVFPGCSVVDWMPVRRPPSGKVLEALQYVVNWLLAHPDGLLRFVEVSKALGMDRSNFRDVRLHGDFVRAIQAEGIEEYRPKKYAVGFRYAVEEVPSGGAFEDYFPAQDDADLDEV